MEWDIYPLVITHIAIENDHRNYLIFPLNMVIFHSYVKLPEDIYTYICICIHFYMCISNGISPPVLFVFRARFAQLGA